VWQVLPPAPVWLPEQALPARALPPVWLPELRPLALKPLERAEIQEPVVVPKPSRQ
jgi:hypothetical protein